MLRNICNLHLEKGLLNTYLDLVKTYPTIALTACIFLAPAVLCAADVVTSAPKADALVRAAQNYELASEAREETAESLLSIAREYRRTIVANESDRLKNMALAANEERKAGDLLLAAMQGYDKASAAWANASRELRIAGSKERSSELVSASAAATRLGTKACRRAAEAFEYSAEAFSVVDLVQMAVSSEKAAQLRELLASRI